MRKERRNIEEHERRRRTILEEHQATNADLMLPAIDEKQQFPDFQTNIFSGSLTVPPLKIGRNDPKSKADRLPIIMAFRVSTRCLTPKLPRVEPGHVPRFQGFETDLREVVWVMNGVVRLCGSQVGECVVDMWWG